MKSPSKSAYILALLSFIPLLGFFWGLVFGFKSYKKYGAHSKWVVLICFLGIASTVYIYTGLFRESLKYQESEEYQKLAGDANVQLKELREHCGTFDGSALFLSIELVHVQNQNYLFVRSIKQGSRWVDFGFQSGDMIMQVNGKELSKAGGRFQITAAACKDDSTFIILRDGNKYTLSLNK